MVTITKMNDDTWCLDEGGVRFFLLTGKERALLIDSGMKTRDALELARSLTELPVALLNTHADPDHIGSNGEFSSFYMHPAEAGNFYKEHQGKGEILPVWDGDILDLGDRPLSIIHLPGHTPGSIGILDVNQRALFSGDVVQDSRVFLFGPRRELHAYVLSLKRLEGMMKGFAVIHPSHGTLSLQPEFITSLRESAERLLLGKLTGKPVDMFGIRAVYYEDGAAKFLYDC